MAIQQSRDNRKTNKKAISSLFTIEMIEKLEWTQSNAQQNIEQLQNPTMEGTINAHEAQQQNHRLSQSHWGA